MRVGLVVAALLALGCSRKEPEPVEKKAPWLAKAPDASAAVRAKFALSDRCEARLELKAKEGTPRGTFRVCRGELDLNLSDLTDSRGTLAVDVASIEIRGDGDAGRSDEQTQDAQNWLDVGASRPEAERERMRWATFTLTSVVDASSSMAHSGRRERVEPEAEEAPSPPDDDGGRASASERRSVTMTARGHLLLHRVRVDVEVPIRVGFHYAGRASADAVPDRLQLTTRRPVLVSLAAHDIKPRDAAGVFQAQGMKLIGTKVGADARVSLSASAVLKK